MVVSGLPVENDQHASEIAKMAIQLRTVVGEIKIREQDDEKLRMRIGIHTGMIEPKLRCIDALWRC